jgi:endonuclease/exonuclease/phosphatase (EEP) superfamily protein YafD
MRFVRFLVYCACILAFAGLVAGYFGWFHPAFDSFSAFRLHLAVLTMIGGALLALMGGRLGGISVAVAACVSLYGTLAPGLASAHAASESGASYRLLQINVRFDNPTPKDLLRLIGETRPDVITAQEVTTRWRAEFATIKAAYPYQLYCAAHRKIGDVAILSRRPFVDAPANYCGKGAAVAVQAVKFGDQTLNIGSIHLFWPWPYQQPAQILEMGPVLETLGKVELPILVAGDLNAPRWSQAARDIARYSGTNTINYQGASWLAYEFPKSWTKWAGLAIDNVFSADVKIRRIETKAHVGSDHLPMLIEFSLLVRASNEKPEPMVG